MRGSKGSQSVYETTRLGSESLRHIVDPLEFPFETTEKLPKLTDIVGQERGRKVMEFGLNVNQIGYNLYVAGLSGTGKTSFTHTIVNEVAKREVELFDWCYVNNFEDGYKPIALKLPVGMGRKFQKDMGLLIERLQEDIPEAFNDEAYQKEKAAILRNFQEMRSSMYKEMNNIASDHGFVIRQSGSRMVTIPLLEGKPMSEEKYQSLTPEEIKDIENRSTELQENILDATNKLRELEVETKEIIEKVDNKIARGTIDYRLEEMENKYKKCRDVLTYLLAVRESIVQNIRDFLVDEQKKDAKSLEEMIQKNQGNPFKKYEVNLFVDNRKTKGAPVVVADNPTYYNVIGKVEYEGRMGVMSTDFTKIKPGYLHYANGGYLIIQAKDIFSKTYAWEGLKRALLNQKLQIENLGEQSGLMTTTSISPEPIPLNVKVIIIGNMDIYQTLYHYDEDFSKLFKIRADFDVVMDFTKENMMSLASFIHTQCKDNQLRHFDRSAVARMVEYSVKLAGHQQKLSTHFNQQVEKIFEADAWANMMGDSLVTATHIQKAIDERRYRSSLFEEKMKESIQEGNILIDTEGKAVGQVNGLAVYNLGQYSFGKPSRITASTFIGRNGIINIERESKMSGNIHNKGVYILGGYLGEMFAQKYPLTLTAHLAFEQSYSGVDGDSASSTELYALLSSLSNIPIQQGLAVTGSVNQKGEIQPIGGVNEKIEGFFEVCEQRGLTGEQGVLIPHQNTKNLMLKNKVVQAVEEGIFHIYEIRTIEEGIEILTGVKAGQLDKSGEYDEHTVFGKVAEKLRYYAEVSKEDGTIQIYGSR